MSRTEDLERAVRLADTADRITQKYYRSAQLKVTIKPDATPVTQADLEVERALSKIVLDEFGDGYIGEEGVRNASKNTRAWVVDPIDGTRNFLRGMPVWATLISLSDASETLVGMVSAPALGRRWWAVRGQGAFTRDTDGSERQLHVSGVNVINNAFLLYASIFSWDKTLVGSQAMLDLLKSAWRHRSVGDFMNYMLVAEGAADGCFEPDPKQWDVAAPGLIVTEAGGSIWTSAGAATPPEAARISIASNGFLEAELKSILTK